MKVAKVINVFTADTANPETGDVANRLYVRVDLDGGIVELRLAYTTVEEVKQAYKESKGDLHVSVVDGDYGIYARLSNKSNIEILDLFGSDVVAKIEAEVEATPDAGEAPSPEAIAAYMAAEAAKKAAVA